MKKPKRAIFEACPSCFTLTKNMETGKCENPKHRKAHRGSFFDFPLIGIIGFVMIFVAIMTYMIGNSLFTNLPAQFQTGIPATFFNAFRSMNGILDGIMVLIYITMTVVSAALARRIFSPSPAFWVVGIILAVVMNFAWVALANIFIGFINASPEFAVAAQAFPYSSFIIQNYALFMIFQAAILGWAMWGKPSGGGAYYA